MKACIFDIMIRYICTPKILEKGKYVNDKHIHEHKHIQEHVDQEGTKPQSAYQFSLYKYGRAMWAGNVKHKIAEKPSVCLYSN